MIYYDKSAWFGFRFMFQWRGSIIGSAMPYVIMWTGYCACVVAIIKMEVERRDPSIKVEVPGLDGLTFVAGFMLSMQGGIAFKRYENALSGYSSLDNTCAELTRHAAMILDVEEQNELRHELRRVMIATLLTVRGGGRGRRSHFRWTCAALGFKLGRGIEGGRFGLARRFKSSNHH